MWGVPVLAKGVLHVEGACLSVIAFVLAFAFVFVANVFRVCKLY